MDEAIASRKLQAQSQRPAWAIPRRRHALSMGWLAGRRTTATGKLSGRYQPDAVKLICQAAAATSTGELAAWVGMALIDQQSKQRLSRFAHSSNGNRTPWPPSCAQLTASLSPNRRVCT